MARKIMYGWEMIAGYYRALIADGRIGEGERMPSIRAAAEDWGVTPPTVARAWRDMREAGLVEMLGGAKGTVVATRAKKPAREDDLLNRAG